MKSKKIIATVGTIIIIIACITAYYLTRPSAPTPETPPRIVSYTHYTETIKNTSITFYKVIGEIQNNLKTNIKSVNVTATFFDPENNTIAIRTSRSELDIIEPNQRVPFEVYLLLDPTPKVPDRYELTLSYVKTNEETKAGLEIMIRAWTIDDTTGYHIIKGEIHNNGQRKASAVKILCTYYDSQGNVQAISRTYVSSVIYSGEKVTFEITSNPHKIGLGSDFELLTIAHLEQLPIGNYVFLTILILAFVSFIVYMKRRKGW